MKIERKYVIAGAIMLGSITLGLLYLQIQKFKQFCIGLKQIKYNSFTWTKADLDLFITFRNRSNFKLTIFSQQYLVYLNDKQVLKVSNAIAQNINPTSDSVLSAKLTFSPKEALEAIKMNISDLLTRPEQVIIKINVQVTVGIGIIKFDIPYDISMSLKDMMSGKGNDSHSIKC